MKTTLSRSTHHLDCPVSGHSSCALAAIRSKPHGVGGRADWFECEHGYDILIIIHRWVK